MELAELLNWCKGENMYYIGNHLPVSKGYAVMGEMALKLGGNTFAFFTRNPRGGKAKEIDEDDVNELLNITEENGFGEARCTCAIYNELVCWKGRCQEIFKRSNF